MGGGSNQGNNFATPFSAAIGSNGSYPCEAVRKQVTVLFCDIANFTSKSLSMDPEELADEVRQFQITCTRISDRYNGQIINFLGDGILVVFGHPESNEFDAQRAVRAGVQMVEDMVRNSLSKAGRGHQTIRVRVGIATGIVVIGEKAGRKRDQDVQVFGEAPVLAARLQQIATPGTVAVSETTRRLAGNTFKFRRLENARLKGYAESITAWQPVCRRSYQSRFHGLPNRAEAPLVGRCRELAILSDYFTLAMKGVPGFIHLVGDAGMGKSRLIHEFEKTLNRQEIYRVRINCSPCDYMTPLHPVISELNRWLHRGKSPGVLYEGITLHTDIARMLLAQRETQNTFAMLYSLLYAAAPKANSVVWRNRSDVYGQVISLLAEMLFLLARNHPVLLVVEDIQWSDPVTLDLLSFIENNLAGQQLFAILTSRRKYRLGLRPSSCVTRLRLAGLDRQHSAVLIRSFLGNEPRVPGLENAIYRKCSGVPLYLESYCRHIRTRSTASVSDFCNTDSIPVPDFLQDAINAKLDRLGEARKLVQMISVLGSYFNHPTISTLAELNYVDIDRCLDKLLRNRLIKVVTDKPATSYVFLQPLLLDAAGQSLLKETRRRYQRQINELRIPLSDGIREPPSR